MRRLLASLVVVAVVPVGIGSHDAAAQVASKATPAQRCADAAKAFANLPPPATLDDVVGAIGQSIRFAPSNDVLNRLSSNPRSAYLAATSRLYGSALWLDPTGDDTGSLTQAITTQDGPVANKLLSDLQGIYAALDRARRKEKLPAACSSAAFGSAYFAQAAPIVARELALTGDFATDANAACTRLGTKVSAAEGRVDITDISSVQDLVTDAYNSFLALQIDLRAITPPPAAAQPYAQVQQIVDKAVNDLHKAQSPSTSTRDFQRLSQELPSLADPITTAANAAGFSC